MVWLLTHPLLPSSSCSLSQCSSVGSRGEDDRKPNTLATLHKRGGGCGVGGKEVWTMTSSNVKGLYNSVYSVS